MAPRPDISHVVFDFDGTLSWLRHGWPRIMAGLFAEYVRPQPGESKVTVEEVLLEDVLSLNGKPPIHQMQRCAERVRERGGTPPDPEELLREYSSRLQAAIRERTGKIRSGRAKPDEFLVHGARALIEQLERRGLTLIILSGTLRERVQEEAELLGLTHHFQQRIYGSTPQPEGWTKQAVLSCLLREERVAGQRLLSFGDGPVEIEVTKAAGGLAVGVASDEQQNGSGKFDPHKRKLLIAAGADLVIPDYREPDALLARILTR